MDIYSILGYAGAVLTGLVLGFLGGGGALFSIPVLVYFFHVPASIATGYSLFLVGVTASIGTVQKMKASLIDYNAMLYYGIPSAVVVFIIRRFVIHNLPENIFSTESFTVTKDHLILLLLCTAMVIAGYKMIKSSGAESSNAEGGEANFLKLGLYAMAVGSFLGIVGAGGGFLMVPALALFAKLPMKKALGTSLVLVAVNSFIGFLGDLSGNVTMEWPLLLSFSAFSVAGVFGGNFLQHRFDGARLKIYFGWFIIAMAAVIAAKEIYGM